MSDAAEPRAKILVVDDEPVVQRMLLKSLESEGFEVLIAADGEQAYGEALRHRPALVLLDLMMPRYDGYHFLARRAQDPLLRDTPVVILTAHGSEEQVIKAIDAGADDFLAKPVSLLELAARLRARLRDRQTVDDLRGQREDQELLLALSTDLVSQRELKEILFTVASRLAEMIHVDRVSFIIVSRDLQHGYVLAASEDPEAHNIRVALDNYPEIREVLEHRRSLVVPDVALHPLLTDVKDAIARTEMRSLMLFPLVVGDEVLGVLFLRARSRRHELSAREERVCRIVANATAVALRNYQTVQAIRGESQKLRVESLKAERKVRMLKRYEEFCEYASDGMATVDAGGKVLFVNRAAERILGRSRVELVGQNLADLVAPEDRELAEMAVSDAAAGMPVRAYDLGVPGPDHRVRTVSLTGAALFGEHGAAVLSFRDVTEERTLAADLRKTKDFLEGLVRQSVDAIVAADLLGRILLWNEAAERLFLYGASEAVGVLQLEQLFPPGETAELLRMLRGQDFGGKGRLGPVRREIVARNGVRVPVRMSAALLYDGDRESALFCILSDLRPREELEARLAKAQQALSVQEKNAVLAELAGTAAHELNQPLTSLLGLAEILRRGLAQGNPLRATVDSLTQEAERIAEIVRKLGKTTRYETKAYVGGTKIVDLDRSVDDE
jgi:PAS domain S-box-containing protein